MHFAVLLLALFVPHRNYLPLKQDSAQAPFQRGLRGRVMQHTLLPYIPFVLLRYVSQTLT